MPQYTRIPNGYFTCHGRESNLAPPAFEAVKTIELKIISYQVVVQMFVDYVTEPNPTESSPSSRGRAGAPTPARTRGGGARSPAGAVRSPSEARAADGAAAAEPAAAFVEVENQLEKMFAGLEEDPRPASDREDPSGECSVVSSR